MPKSKYESHVKPRLKEIAEWAGAGLYERDIAKKLAVAPQTFCEYKEKHPELTEALIKGRTDLVAELKNKLVERALGYTYTETRTFATKDKGGERITKIEKVEKHQAPDVGALIFALKNFDRDEQGKSNWTNDPELLQLRKDELALKQLLAENSIGDWQALGAAE